MIIFGKRLSEYVAFAKPFMILVLVIGTARLGLSLAGVPNETTRWLSITVAGWIGIIYFALRVRATGFGSYKQLLVLVACVNLTNQVIAIVAIAIAAVTGVENVFSAPEFSFGTSPIPHLLSHVFIGTTAGTLVGWAMGSLIMWISGKVTGNARPALKRS